jgi:hypothetical protein
MALLPTRTDLLYNIVEGTLVGSIDGVSISAQAGSGGRAGSKTKGALNIFVANNPFATRVKKAGMTPGGPLPMARYELRPHESRANWIRLTPIAEDGKLLHGRDGFAIHGRGPWGSDGCIVPTDFTVVKLLHKLAKARQAARKPAPTLEVIAVGDLDRFDRLNSTA